MNTGMFKCPTGFIIISTILIISSLKISGQASPSAKDTRNSISLDGATLKFTGTFAFSYERTIIHSRHFKMLAGTGIGGWYLTTISKWYCGPSVPLSINNLVGSGNSYFETDLGIRYTSFSRKSDKGKFAFFPVFNLGYRYQRPDGRGLMFRSFVGLSGIGIGVGKAF